MPDYEITITVSPIHQVNGMRYGKMIASKQWEWLQFLIYETLKKHDIDYEIYAEFHKNMNIHVHGHAVVSESVSKMDIVDILKRFNQVGRSNFQLLNNKTHWLDYIKKDYEEIKSKYTSPYYLEVSRDNVVPGDLVFTG